MATSPQPPRPPVPPPPPRSSSNVVPIVLLILALIIVVSGIAVWTGLRYLSQSVRVQVQESGAGKKEVSIKTPIGSLEVHPQASEAALGLPVYPGAQPVKEDKGATVDFDFANEATLRIVVGKYETPDPLEKVRDFYRERLGDQVTKFTEKTPDGKTVFEMKSGDPDCWKAASYDCRKKVVALKSVGDGTRIELVQISNVHQEGN